MSEPNYVRIRFGPNETGWAEDLGDGTYRLANLPAISDVHFRAVVTVKDVGEGPPHIDKVIDAGHPNQYCIRYLDKPTFVEMSERASKLWPRLCLEGYLPPSDTSPGIASLSFDDSIDDISDVFDGLDVELEMVSYR